MITDEHKELIIKLMYLHVEGDPHLDGNTLAMMVDSWMDDPIGELESDIREIEEEYEND